MNKVDFALIGCRLLALYWIVMALYTLSSFVIALASWNEYVNESSSLNESVIYFGLVPLGLYVSAALVLWFGANRIVHFMVPSETKNSGGSITFLQAQSIAFSVVGLFLLFSALPEIAMVLYKIHLMKVLDSNVQISFDTKAQILEVSLRIILGGILLLGSNGLSGILIRIRELGMK